MITTFESLITDTGYTIFDDDFFGGTVFPGVGCHFTGTGDGQETVVGQGPGEVVTAGTAGIRKGKGTEEDGEKEKSEQKDKCFFHKRCLRLRKLIPNGGIIAGNEMVRNLFRRAIGIVVVGSRQPRCLKAGI